MSYLPIKEQDAGQRIDNFLLKHLKGVPRSHVYRLLRSGQVRIDGGRVKPHRRLQAGEQVRIPPVRLRAQQGGRPNDELIARVEAAVLYEDADLLVLNKPAGVTVHAGSGVRHGVIETLRAARSEAAFLELAHRLDRETSGCLLLAKNRDSLNAAQRALRKRQVNKRYLALLVGRWQAQSETLDVPLVRDVQRGGECMSEVSAQGKRALTEFKLRQRYADTTLVEAHLHTGRTHQIRVHAAHLGHPVAGDRKYGDRQANKVLRDQGLKRMFLHAWRLSLELSGHRLDFEAPLPTELEVFLASQRLG